MGFSRLQQTFVFRWGLWAWCWLLWCFRNSTAGPLGQTFVVFSWFRLFQLCKPAKLSAFQLRYFSAVLLDVFFFTWMLISLCDLIIIWVHHSRWKKSKKMYNYIYWDETLFACERWKLNQNWRIVTADHKIKTTRDQDAARHEPTPARCPGDAQRKQQHHQQAICDPRQMGA